jgi:hypothetical protein
MCPELDEIGAAANILCQPFPTADISTIEADPQEVFLRLAYMGGERDTRNRTCRNSGSSRPNFQCRIAEATEDEYLEVTRPNEHNFGVLDTRAFRETETGVTVSCSGDNCAARRGSGDQGGSYSGTMTVTCPGGANAGNCTPTNDIIGDWRHISGNRYEIHHRYITEIIPGRDGIEVVQEKSNLAEYITYCSNRMSPFGQEDTQIVASLMGALGTQTAGRVQMGLSFIPIVGDVASIVDAAATIEAMKTGYVRGENCVTGGNFRGGSLAGWHEETRWLAQYSLDVRIYENMEAIQTAPTTAYINFLETVNEAIFPVVDSYETYLALRTGLSLQETRDSLALINKIRNMPAVIAETSALLPAATLTDNIIVKMLNERKAEAQSRSRHTMPNFLAAVGLGPRRFDYRGAV